MLVSHIFYPQTYLYTLPIRVPIVLHLSVRNNSSIKNFPYNPTLLTILADAVLATSQEIQGCVLSYFCHNQVFFILRNDFKPETEAWFNNSIQDIISVTTSLLTKYTCKYLSLNDLTDDIFYSCHTYTLPSLEETIEHLIFQQTNILSNAIDLIFNFEIEKQFGKKSAHATRKLSTQDKLNILTKECNVDIMNYPTAFTLGMCGYKNPKWILDWELPKFPTKEGIEFLKQIIFGEKL